MPSPRSSGPRKKFRAAELTRVFPMAISPPSGLSRPATQRSKVVLPDPLKPSNTKNSRSATSIVTASTARTESPPELKIFRRFLIEIIVWAVGFSAQHREKQPHSYISLGDLQLDLR